MSDTYQPEPDTAADQPQALAPPAEQDTAETAARNRELAGARFARSTLKKNTPDKLLPQVTSDEDVEKLPYGAEFIDPEGGRRRKPWVVKTDADIAQVPEGAQFIDPEGELRQKPVFQPIDYTAQTLYNMATNDRERRRALERSYPGKVREDVEGLYIEDDGPANVRSLISGKTGNEVVLRRPKGFGESPGAFVTGMAAPGVGSVVGEIGGGLVGNLPGAIVGGGVGAMAGQTINDIVLGLTGIYDRGVGEQLTETALAGGFGAAGTAVGRAVAPAVAAFKGAKIGAPALAANFLGADAEGLATAIALREKGVELVPPSMWAMEAPHVQNVVEVLDPAFRTQQPLKQAAEAHYEKQSKSLLSEMGVEAEGSIIRPTQAPPTEEAGRALKARAVERHLVEQTEADARLAQEVEIAKAAAQNRVAMSPEQQEALRRAQIEAEGKANLLIRIGFDDIEQGVKEAMTVAKAGSNSGDLWQAVGDKLKALRQGVSQRATGMYRQADELAADHLPDIEGLPKVASDFLDQLPEGFASRYPVIVQKLRDLAGVRDPKTQEFIKEPVQPSFGQLHNLRSDLRANVNWFDLPSDIRNGTYKFFQNKVDDVIQAPLRAMEEEGPVFSRYEASKYRTAKLPGDPSVDQFLERGKPLLVLTDHEASTYGVADKLKQAAGQRSAQFLADGRVPATIYWQPGREAEAQQLLRMMEKPDFKNPNHHRDVGKLLGYPQSEIDAFVGDTSRETSLANAARALNATDKWYGENIRLFEARNLKTIMDGLRAGEPADPAKLAEAILKPGHSDLTREILDKIGPNLANAVRAADVQSMLDASKTLVPGQINGRAFAKEILDREQANMLHSVHGRVQGDKLLKQAQMIEALEGRIDIPVRPGDTAMDVVARARQAAEQAETAAKQDPLKALQSEMRKIEGQQKQAVAQRLKEQKKTDPLSFLYDPTVGASASVNRILKSEDLILAAGAQFGQDSTEFGMLRQIWAQRLLQGTTRPGERLANVSPEVQNIMFPGVRLAEMQTLAREMDFLMNTKAARSGAGKSIMATEKVEHPLSSIPGGKLVGKIAIGSEPVARAALGNYYKLVTTLSSNLAFMRWVQKGLAGDEQARQMVKQQVQKAMQVGGAMGAGGAEALYQTPPQPGN